MNDRINWEEHKPTSLSVDEVIELIKGKANSCVIDGHEVNVHSLRLSTFAYKGIRCVECGVQGDRFEIVRSFGQFKYHLEFLGTRPNGRTALMTKDHIQPKSHGGKDTLDNMQTMCGECNQRKGNAWDIYAKLDMGYACDKKKAELLTGDLNEILEYIRTHVVDGVLPHGKISFPSFTRKLAVTSKLLQHCAVVSNKCECCGREADRVFIDYPSGFNAGSVSVYPCFVKDLYTPVPLRLTSLRKSSTASHTGLYCAECIWEHNKQREDEITQKLISAVLLGSPNNCPSMYGLKNVSGCTGTPICTNNKDCMELCRACWELATLRFKSFV